MRKIASNLLLDSEGLHRNPLVELSDAGMIHSITTTPHPDREPFTEFYAGVLVVGLEGCNLRVLADQAETPIEELLCPYLNPANRTLCLISGLNYERHTLTAKSRIHLF